MSKYQFVSTLIIINKIRAKKHFCTSFETKQLIKYTWNVSLKVNWKYIEISMMFNQSDGSGSALRNVIPFDGSRGGQIKGKAC